ncbi:MAG: hypothetical protein ACTHOH_16315 [Lysobacteraceae bacterium]
MRGTQKITIYLNNFDVQNPSPTSQPSIEELGLMARDIGNSGFTVGVLGAARPRERGLRTTTAIRSSPAASCSRASRTCRR